MGRTPRRFLNFYSPKPFCSNSLNQGHFQFEEVGNRRMCIFSAVFQPKGRWQDFCDDAFQNRKPLPPLSLLPLADAKCQRRQGHADHRNFRWLRDRGCHKQIGVLLGDHGQ